MTIANRGPLQNMTVAALALIGSVVACASGYAQAPEVGTWELEEVLTADGKTYRGLIHTVQGGEMEFVEVVQPRGKPMYLVVRPLDVDKIVSQKRLPADERRQLSRRIHVFRFRSRIEAGRMENVELAAHEEDERRYLRSRGPWFVVDSTADEETTRRCVVRIAQIFRAYRQMLPPRVRPQEPLRILLFSSMDEYRTFLDENDVEIANPAVYFQSDNVVAAGSELTRYARRLQTARHQHAAIRARYEQLDAELPDRLAELRKKLADAGVNRRVIDKEINARKALWKTEMDEAFQKLNAADRRNERRFQEVTDEMFRRIYHEAFHAYLENFLYPSEQYDVPVWLNEGLAQFFQSGRLEADTLRIDAPLAEALQTVQQDLQSEEPLLLSEVLQADARDFLRNGGNRRRANRLYAHAWALVYYLAFYEPVLGTAAVDEYVAKDVERSDAIVRFQKLVDVPLSEFEEQWRATILSLRPAR